jgi:hypothetical protein
MKNIIIFVLIFILSINAKSQDHNVVISTGIPFQTSLDLNYFPVSGLNPYNTYSENSYGLIYYSLSYEYIMKNKIGFHLEYNNQIYRIYDVVFTFDTDSLSYTDRNFLCKKMRNYGFGISYSIEYDFIKFTPGCVFGYSYMEVLEVESIFFKPTFSFLTNSDKVLDFGVELAYQINCKQRKKISKMRFLEDYGMNGNTTIFQFGVVSVLNLNTLWKKKEYNF